MENQQIAANLKNVNQWQRILFMVLFVFLLYPANVVIWVLVAVQALFALVTGKDNLKLRQFGGSLSMYVYQMLQFLTYCSEAKPFPFSDWPHVEVSDVVEAEVVEEEKKAGKKAD